MKIPEKLPPQHLPKPLQSPQKPPKKPPFSTVLLSSLHRLSLHAFPPQ